jgi:SAM-dependent methyltransferase
MKREWRYHGTLGYLYAHWPTYLTIYTGIVLTLIVVGVSADRGWFGFIPLALAVMLILIYFLLASLWGAHLLYDRDGVRPHHILFDMGHINSTDTFVYIDLGLRQRAISLSRRLTTGKIIILDVYNPQQMPGRALARRRARVPPLPPDPRLVWRVSPIDLLPLPDKGVSAVILCQVLSEFWQHGDRVTLLQEIHRILRPNGRLLLAERARTQTNWLLIGPAALSLPSIDYWRELLTESGFYLRQEHNLQGISHCFHAQKPTPAEARQLALELEI